MTTSTAQRHAAVDVPKLLLPSAEPGGDDSDCPTFRRQINVALGRSHSQRTARRDVIFGIRQGGMVEKQRPLLMGLLSHRTREQGNDGDASNMGSQTSRYEAFSPEGLIRKVYYDKVP